VGLLLRRGGGTDTRPLGTILVIIGVVLLAFVAALMALLLAGWGRGI
jgi:hypothetical protein